MTITRGTDQPMAEHIPAVPNAIIEHYTYRHSEAQRLGSTLKGRLERERVRELLDQYLPTPPAHIADVGGGPGVHAGWLQARGHTVVLLDPVQHHINQAAQAGIAATRGDARCLPWPDQTFDAVLLAGPLYHLPRLCDRRRSLAEAVRVLRPSGVVVAVAINRAANLIGAALANTFPRRRHIIEQILNAGHSPDNDRMAATYYHTTPELRSELNAAGLVDVTVRGLTGPGGWLTVAIDAHFTDNPLPDTLTRSDPLDTALEASRLADHHPELVSSSALLFAVGRRGRC